MPAPLLYLVTVLFAAPPPAPPDVLPLRKLRLYETGVGYFERRGGVKPGVDLSLPLPASHLDDALKSLVILDASGDTRVQGLKFASAMSESGARAMAGLPRADDDAVAYVDVLRSLEGAQVEIRHAGTRAEARVQGTVIDIEGPFSPPPPRDDAPASSAEPWHAVVLVDADGGIHRVRTDAIRSIKATDAGTQGRLRVAAMALSEQSARRPHPVGVDVSSTGQIGLGYISEAPVWRTTYRVVLPDQGVQASLQAWALVHNDTDEDWHKVALELANGRPQSFLYPLASPRYAYREVTGPDESLSTVPQLATETVDRMWGDGGDGFALAGIGSGGGGSGEGTIGLGSVGLIGHGGGGLGDEGPRIGDLAQLSQAEGEESGSLFIYKLVDPLDLDAHHSALVPIVQQAVEAESISWFPRGQSEALTGARVVNTTTQTLPAGVVSLFAGGGFVGESALHRLKPKERQFVVFGTEQDVELHRSASHGDETVVDVSYRDGTLTVQVIDRETHTLDLHNRSGRARKVYVALDVGTNAEVDGDVDLDFDLDTQSALVIVDVPGGESASRTFGVKTGGAHIVDIQSDGELETLAKATQIPAHKRDLLTGALGHRAAMRKAQGQVAALSDGLRREEDELDRLRADLDALGRVRLRGRVAKKLARQLLETEARVEERRDAIKDARDAVARERRLAQGELARL